jgi:hypothetical protein
MCSAISGESWTVSSPSRSLAWGERAFRTIPKALLTTASGIRLFVTRELSRM